MGIIKNIGTQVLSVSLALFLSLQPLVIFASEGLFETTEPVVAVELSVSEQISNLRDTFNNDEIHAHKLQLGSAIQSIDTTSQPLSDSIQSVDTDQSPAVVQHVSSPSEITQSHRALYTQLQQINTSIKDQFEQYVASNLSRREFRQATADGLLEPDYLYILDGTATNDTYAASQTELELFSNDYLAHYTNAPSRKTIVAVIDAGVDYNHADLSGNIVTLSSCVDADKQPIIAGCPHGGWDFVQNDNTPYPSDGAHHGTAVSGIIAATTANNTGIASLSANTVQIMPLRVANNGIILSSDIARAIRFAVHNGADVINTSLSGPTISTAVHNAIAYAQTNNVLVVAAAGNQGNNLDTHPVYPAAFANSNVITVGSVESDNTRAAFSNYSSSLVDVAAPGVGLQSLRNNNQYGNISGTSFSAAMVSGLIGYWLAAGGTATNKISQLTSYDSLSGDVSAGKSIVSYPTETVATPLPAVDPEEEQFLLLDIEREANWASKQLSLATNSTDIAIWTIKKSIAHVKIKIYHAATAQEAQKLTVELRRLYSKIGIAGNQENKLEGFWDFLSSAPYSIGTTISNTAPFYHYDMPSLRLHGHKVSNAVTYEFALSKAPYGRDHIVKTWVSDRIVTWDDIPGLVYMEDSRPADFLEPDTRYRWNYRACYNTIRTRCEDQWSQRLYFSTHALPNRAPERPTIAGPTSGVVGEYYTYTFQSTDPDGDRIEYQIAWDGDTDRYTRSDWQVSGTPQSVSYRFASSGTYCIKARATDGSDTSPWTRVCHNVEISGAPSAPTLEQPGGPQGSVNLVDSTSEILFDWTYVSDKDYYKIAVSKYPYGSSNIVYRDNNISSSRTRVSANTFEPNTRYRWDVSACNSNGCSISADLYFQTDPVLLLPDIHSTGINISDTTVSPGDRITIDFTVENTGAATTTTSSTARVYISRNNNISEGDTQVASIQIPSINAGSSHSVTKTKITIPQDLDDDASGEETYYIGIIVDDDDVLTESNERNNEDKGIGIDKQSITIDFSDIVVDVPTETPKQKKEKILTGVGSKKSRAHVARQTDSSVVIVDDINYDSSNSASIADPSGADPINLRTGGFELAQTDFKLNNGILPLDFTRVYNSKHGTVDGRFGHGWSFSYNSFYFKNESNTQITVYKGGPYASKFKIMPGATTEYVAMNGDTDVLREENGHLVLESLSGVTYVFGKMQSPDLGVLTSIRDTNGNDATITYITRDEALLPSTITDGSNRSIQLTYGAEDSKHWDKVVKLSVTQDPTYYVTYTYDKYNNLTSYTRTNGTQTSTESFEYNDRNYMTTYTDPRGAVLHNTNDTTGRVTAQYEYNPGRDTDPTKPVHVYDLAYDISEGSNTCTTVTTYSDSPITEKFCFNNDLQVSQSAGETTLLYGRNELGLIERLSDAENHSTRYSYDSRRRVVTETLPPNGNHQTRIDRTYEDRWNRIVKEKITVITTDSEGRETSETRETNYTIDPANGNILTETNPAGHVKRYRYNNKGLLESVVDFDNSNTVYQYGYVRDPVTRRSSRGDHVASESTSVVNSNGSNATASTIRYEYDNLGRQTAIFDALNRRTQFTYDSRGNITSRTDTDNLVTRFEYDNEDHLIVTTYPDGTKQRYTYDTTLEAKITKTEYLDVAGNVVRTKTAAYDTAGNVTSEVSISDANTSVTYDTAGRLSTTTDADGVTTTYAYTPDGHLASVTTSIGEKTEYTYDSRGNKKTTKVFTDPTTFIVEEYFYDGFDQLIATVDGDGNRTAYSYDVLGRQTLISDSTGVRQLVRYDKMGNITSSTDALLRTTSHTYNQRNQVLVTTDPDGLKTSHTYDAQGQLISTAVRYTTDPSTAEKTVHYAYDPRGNILSQWENTTTNNTTAITTPSSYDYKQQLTITGARGSGSDYQVLLKIGRDSAAVGADFHLAGSAQSFPRTRNDGGDIIFYDNNQTTALPFWVEKVYQNVAYVWVKVADNLDSNQDIYIYYGKSDATNYSDGRETFELFDEFESANIDTTIWNVSGTAAIINGRLVVGDQIADDDKVYSRSTFGINHRMKWSGRIQNELETTTNKGFHSLAGNDGIGFQTQSVGGRSIQTHVNSSSIPTSIAAGHVGEYQIERTSDGSGTLYIDGVAQSRPAGTVTASMPAYWHTGRGLRDTVDYVWVSKFNDIEPQFHTTRGEELSYGVHHKYARIAMSSGSPDDLGTPAELQESIQQSHDVSLVVPDSEGDVSTQADVPTAGEFEIASPEPTPESIEIDYPATLSHDISFASTDAIDSHVNTPSSVTPAQSYRHTEIVGAIDGTLSEDQLQAHKLESQLSREKQTLANIRNRKSTDDSQLEQITNRIDNLQNQFDALDVTLESNHTGQIPLVHTLTPSDMIVRNVRKTINSYNSNQKILDGLLVTETEPSYLQIDDQGNETYIFEKIILQESQTELLEQSASYLRTVLGRLDEQEQQIVLHRIDQHIPNWREYYTEHNIETNWAERTVASVYNILNTLWAWNLSAIAYASGYTNEYELQPIDGSRLSRDANINNNANGLVAFLESRNDWRLSVGNGSIDLRFLSKPKSRSTTTQFVRLYRQYIELDLSSINLADKEYISSMSLDPVGASIRNNPHQMQIFIADCTDYLSVPTCTPDLTKPVTDEITVPVNRPYSRIDMQMSTAGINRIIEHSNTHGVAQLLAVIAEDYQRSDAASHVSRNQISSIIRYYTTQHHKESSRPTLRVKTKTSLTEPASTPAEWPVVDITNTDQTTTTTYTYDNMGRVTSTSEGGITTTYTYDALGNKITETDADGDTTSYQYDSAGNVTRVTLPSGKQQNRTYDNMERLLTVTENDGIVSQTNVYTQGRLHSTTDGRGGVTTYTYDAAGRVLTVTNPQSTVTTYTYDARDNITSIAITNGTDTRTTSYTYDHRGQQTSITHPTGRIERYGYNADGQQSTYTDGKGQLSTNTYDTAGRLITTTYADNSTDTYTYDAYNNLTSVTTGDTKTTYTYDTRGRVLSQSDYISADDTQPATVEEFVYNNKDQIVQRVLANGDLIDYTYTASGQQDTVTLSQTNGTVTILANDDYNADGFQTTRTYGNGISQTYGYDNRNRTNNINISKNNNRIWNQSYTYDASSNRTTDILNGTVTNYTYDQLDQLLTAGTTTYTYNKFGDRISDGKSYTYNSGGLLTNQQGKRYTYDDNDSLTGHANTITHTYDARGQLSNYKQETYTYDHQGRRSKLAGGKATYYVNRGTNVVYELDSNNNITKTIIDDIAEINNAHRITYTHRDVLDSTVLLTNNAGTTVGTYTYNQFGESKHTGFATTNYQYTGQENDGDLLYYGGRYYNPTIGRFISPDINRRGDVLTYNRYIYVRNNPFKYTDPTGWEEQSKWNPRSRNKKSKGQALLDGYLQVVEGTLDGVSRLQISAAIGAYHLGIELYNNPLRTTWDITAGSVIEGYSMLGSEIGDFLYDKDYRNKLADAYSYEVEDFNGKSLKQKVSRIVEKGLGAALEIFSKGKLKAGSQGTDRGITGPIRVPDLGPKRNRGVKKILRKHTLDGADYTPDKSYFYDNSPSSLRELVKKAEEKKRTLSSDERSRGVVFWNLRKIGVDANTGRPTRWVTIIADANTHQLITGHPGPPTPKTK